MEKVILSLMAIFFTIADDLFAQSTPIQIDRPDQTECPFIVPTNYIQVEHGFNVEHSNSTITSYLFPTTLWKYGANEKFELRLITEVNSVKDNNITTTGLSPITVGFKTNLFKEKGILPATSFIGHITTSNVGSKAFKTSYMAPSFRFTMQHTLSKIFSLSYNLGAEWNGETAEPTYIYTLTTGISLTEKLGAYAEIYGFALQDASADHRVDGGFTYLLNNNFIVDISGGVGIINSDLKNYISLGVSYRFKVRK